MLATETGPQPRRKSAIRNLYIGTPLDLLESEHALHTHHTIARSSLRSSRIQSPGTFWKEANGYGETLQIDRIDNARGYFPDNCRWVTAKANQRNRTNNRIVEHGGRRGCIAEWAEWLGVGYGWLYGKVVTRGVPIAEIVRATAAA
jgi:hypothetical protein